MKHVTTLSKGNVMKKTEISTILYSARSTYEYARFNLAGNIYITIIYNRDRTVEIATNSKNLELYHQINSLRRVYTQTRLIDFMFQWINRLNK